MTRKFGILSVLAAAACGLAAPALAQTTLPLPPTPPHVTSAQVAQAPLPLPPDVPTAPYATSAPARLAGPAIDPLAIPQSAPPRPVLPPPIVVPVRTERPPPPATVAADAAGTARAIPAGVEITFGPGKAELNPTTYAAVQALLAQRTPQSTFTVRAYAAGKASDPSIARRLSLARALAVRSVLIHGGIASPQITVLALGDATGGEAADRADITETEPK